MLQSTTSSFKTSSYFTLKSAKSQFTKQQKLRSKNIKKFKFLKEEIYNNHNIFQTLSNVDHFSKTMTAQNIVWSKNYQLKEEINKLKQENSSLKARIWNVQKQNRKMDRQIEAWGLKKTITNSNKLYIDTATAEKVLRDQDYSITSIKIEILNLQKILEERTQTLEEKIQNHKNVKNIKNSLIYQLRKRKIQVYQYLYGSSLQNNEGINQLISRNKQTLVRKNKQLQIIRKNIQLKKKSKGSLQTQLLGINSQLQGMRQVSEKKILTLKDQINKLRTEDESYVNEEVKKLANIRQKYLQFECRMQDAMGGFIKQKIQLRKDIVKWERKVKKVQGKEDNEDDYEKLKGKNQKKMQE